MTAVPTFVGDDGRVYWGIAERAGWCFKHALSQLFWMLASDPDWSLAGHLWLVFGRGGGGAEHAWVEYDTPDGARRVYDLTLSDHSLALEEHRAFGYTGELRTAVGDVDPKSIASEWNAFNADVFRVEAKRPAHAVT